MGVTFQGGKTSTLGQNPRFKTIDIDLKTYIPQKISFYEFDIEKANAYPNADPAELVNKIREYPDSLGMFSLRPKDFEVYAEKVKNDEEEAKAYKK